MSVRSCAFCPKPANSREHFWSAWIGRMFPPTTYDFQRINAVGERKGWSLPNLGAKGMGVCEECNNGWMSRLENEKAKPILEQIIRNGKPALITPERIKSVAAFAFKITVLHDYLNIPDNPFFTVSIGNRFREFLEIPSGIQMWIASFDGRLVRGDQRGFRFKTSIEALRDAEFYSFTYVIGCLVLQILAARWWQGSRSDEYLPVLTPDTIWQPAVIRFWPIQGSPVDWPPSQDLSEDSLQVFAERFQARIAQRIS